MRKGTKIAVFAATMALTFGSLMLFAGPRHCGRGMHSDAYRSWQDRRTGCTELNTSSAEQK